MTKLDLVNILFDRYPDLTLKEIEIAVKTIFQALEESLKLGKRIEIRGFGSFSVVTRNSRLARNPKSGDSIFLEERKVPMFRAGKDLRKGVDIKKD